MAYQCVKGYGECDGCGECNLPEESSHHCDCCGAQLYIGDTAALFGDQVICEECWHKFVLDNLGFEVSE